MDPQQIAMQKMLANATPEYIEFLRAQGYPIPVQAVPAPALVAPPMIAPSVVAPSLAPVAPALNYAQMPQPELNPIQRELARYFGG